MVSVHLFLASGSEHLADYASLGEAVEDLREHWMEEETGPQTFILCRCGGHVAILTRGEDAEVCLTLHRDGRLERHRCRYELDEAGRYLSTEITDLGPVPVAAPF